MTESTWPYRDASLPVDQRVADLLGRATARARLRFDLPSSLRAVVESPTDTPFSTDRPRSRFGDGL